MNRIREVNGIIAQREFAGCIDELLDAGANWEMIEKCMWKWIDNWVRVIFRVYE